MKSTIDNEDKLIDPSHEKKLLSALNRLQKATKDIEKLGYTMYMEAEGGFNVMNGSTHSGIGQQSNQENIVASVRVSSVDCGAW